MTKSKNLWNHLLSTLWFVPGLLVFAGVLLSFFFIGIDFYIADRFGYHPKLFDIQPAGARDLLAVIASSTITVAVTAFSITIVALTLASTQFSPRILRNFMRDMGNQIVLGILVGIFAYCIIILRTIRDAAGENDSGYVPSVSVLFGIILGLITIASLIYFIHHVATSIQATRIISVIAEETVYEIEKNFSTEKDTSKIDDQTAQQLAGSNYLELKADKTGYTQNADAHKLIKLAVKYDLILSMQKKFGQFVIKDTPIFRIFPNRRDFVLSENIVNQINANYEIDDYRTVEGDAAFGLRQIVDIALKALSPAVNDTTTGVICVDYLTAILVCLAKYSSCSSNFFEAGKLRLIIHQQMFEDFFDLAYDQIRQNAGGNVTIIIKQLNSFDILSETNLSLASETERRMRHNLMETEAKLLFELARDSIKTEADLQIISKEYQRISKLLEERKAEL